MVDAEHNEPLIGTTVEIKGTDRRTAADIDGNFSIEVEKGAILRFSYVGYYSKEVEILNDSSFVIVLLPDPDDPGLPDYLIGPCDLSYSCPCHRHSGYKYNFGAAVHPIECDSTKTNPKKQNSIMINH